MIDTLNFSMRLVVSMLLLTICSLLMLIVAILTLFQMRRFYSEHMLTPCGKLMLKIWGIEMEVHHEAPFAPHQTVYIMNHTSTIDMFAIIALGLPNTRFFLSGFLRKLLPLGLIGYLIGIFWTVDQIYREKRVRIFQRASELLKRSGESVCLSPEGERITSGQIGPFNKGAFHLAISLSAPIQPIFIQIPKLINPGKGLNARPGKIHLYIGKPVDTSRWSIERLAEIKEEMRNYYVRWQERLDG